MKLANGNSYIKLYLVLGCGILLRRKARDSGEPQALLESCFF